MSLVAYNSSDDSQSSDEDVEKPSLNIPQDAETVQINEKDETPLVSTSNISKSKSEQNINGNEVQSHDTSTISLLKGLPAPVHSELASEEDELEEVVQPKPSQVSDAPKPPQKHAKQPSKISIPVIEYSSDEEGDEPATKKKKVSTGKSGLFSLLPEPVHVAKKEANRILVPHTLSKRNQTKEGKVQTPVLQAKIEVKPVMDSAPQKHSTPFQALTVYYSDSEDEESGGNFFSISSETSVPSLSARLPSLAAGPDVAIDSSSKNNVPEVTSSTEPSMIYAPDNSMDELGDAEAGVDLSSTDPDAPLDFKTSGNPDAPLSFKASGTAHTAYGLAGPFRAKPGPAYYSPSNTAVPQEYSGVAYGSYQQELMDTAYSETNQEDISQYLQDEQFLRLQGKKQRGKEEINIVDANMDDFVNSSSIELTKGLTEESQQMSHKRNKDNNPTHTQKRKHQITYLAFQAKERELELKNTWSDNRLTKKQTQAKYGF